MLNSPPRVEVVLLVSVGLIPPRRPPPSPPPSPPLVLFAIGVANPTVGAVVAPVAADAVVPVVDPGNAGAGVPAGAPNLKPPG